MKSNDYIIPLSRGAQAFTIELGERRYLLRIQWREHLDGGGWYLDVSESKGPCHVDGIPLVVNEDLLKDFPFFNVGAIWCELDGNEVRHIEYEDVERGRLRMFWRKHADGKLP